MIGFILAAGYGERVRPLSNCLPKVLFPIVGRRVLDHIIAHLKNNGVKKLIINTHWLGGNISSYIKQHKLPLQILEEEKILGTGGGVSQGLWGFDEDIFVIYNGDIITNLNIKKAITTHKKNSPLVTMIVGKNKKFNKVKIKNEKVMGFSEKLHPKYYSFTGISILDRKVRKFFKKGKSYSLIEVYQQLSETLPGSVRCYIPTEDYFWEDIGSFEGYFNVHKKILLEKRKILNEEGGKYFVPPTPIWIEEGVEIGEEVKLKGFTVIGRKSKINGKVELEDCIIWEGVEIKEKGKYKNTIFSQCGAVKVF